MNPYTIIVRPVITEKNTRLNEQGQYTFEVAPEANKLEIKRAIEEIFGVTIKAVNIINVRGKLRQRRTRRGLTRGYTKDYKKAIVTLTADSKTIDVFEGV
jgi:large subunit ribosomal protein L23